MKFWYANTWSAQEPTGVNFSHPHFHVLDEGKRRLSRLPQDQIHSAHAEGKLNIILQFEVHLT